MLPLAQPLLSMSRKLVDYPMLWLGYHVNLRSWLIFIKLMLIIFDERWKAGLFPPGVWFHLSHLGPEFQVLFFLMSVPNRVCGSMGPPCLTYLASYNSSGGPRLFTFANVCVLVGTPAVSKQLRPSETWFLSLVHTW